MLGGSLQQSTPPPADRLVTQASAGFAASVALNPRASSSHASLGKLQLQMGEVTGRHSNLGPTTDLQID